MKTLSKRPLIMNCLLYTSCWGIFVAIEGFRLIGSTDPGKCPLITLGSTQTADEIADYGSLGFSPVSYTHLDVYQRQFLYFIKPVSG